MNPLPSSEMNRRSPRVVSKRRMPWRGLPPGEKYSQTAMPISSRTMVPKNKAVGRVQAIHEKFIASSLHPAQGKALGDVVADEIDNQGARNDGQRARRGQH